MRVLLADDSQLILDRLHEMLQNCEGAEIVDSLKNGKDALDSIISLHPDLVVIDINMPRLSGLQVLEAIKKENHHTKFIVLTFYASNYYRKKALSLGADYFLSKVDDFEKVMNVINDIIAQEDKNTLPIT